MRIFSFILLLLLFFFYSASVSAAIEKQKQKRVENPSTRFRYSAGEIIVKLQEKKINLREKKGVAAARRFATRYKLLVKDILNDANTVVFTIKGKVTINDVIQQLKKDANVVYAEPNYQRSLQKKTFKK